MKIPAALRPIMREKYCACKPTDCRIHETDPDEPLFRRIVVSWQHQTLWEGAMQVDFPVERFDAIKYRGRVVHLHGEYRKEDGCSRVVSTAVRLR